MECEKQRVVFPPDPNPMILQFKQDNIGPLVSVQKTGDRLEGPAGTTAR